MTASLRAPNACSIVRKPEDHRHGDRRSHAPPWSEKIVVNDQIVGTLICQPPGHPTDRHYHLVDEWWFIVEGAIDWEIETMPRRFTRAPGTSSSRRPCTITTSVRPATGRRSAWPSKPWRASTTCANNRYPMRAIGLPATFEAWQAAARALLREGVPPGEVEWREAAGAPASEAPPAGGARVPRTFLDVARQAAGASDPGRWAVLYAVLWRLDRALGEAGLDRGRGYVTNAVKHFKFVERGKRRIHQTPRLPEIAACRPWLEAELEVIKPAVLGCLGATAARAIFGPEFRLLRERGRFIETRWAAKTIATLHPSAVLRGQDDAEQARLYAMLRDDLRLIATAQRAQVAAHAL